MSLERDEGVAAALLATPTHNATQSNTIDKRRPSECMNLCVTVLVNGRGMTSGLSRDDSSGGGSALLAVLRTMRQNCTHSITRKR